jgi:hypothetical protein
MNVIHTDRSVLMLALVGVSTQRQRDSTARALTHKSMRAHAEFVHDSDLDWLCRYAVIQSHRGRSPHDILADQTVVGRCAAGTRRRLLDQPEVIQAVSADTLERLRRIVDKPPRPRSSGRSS